MNRTQKTALCYLVTALLTLTMLAYMFFQFFVLKKQCPVGFAGRLLLLAVLILVIGTLIVWTLKRQSPREVEADERDKLIDNRAAMVFLASAWIVVPAVSVIPRLILGNDGCIPAWSLPLINIGALVIVMMIYSAAVLIQYGWKGRKE